jgi:hypothetical protein
MNDVRVRAECLVREPVRLADLALAFDETVASTVDVHAAPAAISSLPVT